MDKEPSAQLADELANLYALKIALILVPVRRLLVAAERQELAAAIDRLVSDCSADIDNVLWSYHVSRKS